MSETKIIVDLTGPAMIFATIAGPVLAVWASEWRYSRRQSQERREKLFQTLMSTRAIRLNPSHIEALNLIDFVFQGNKYNAVRECWNLYRKHLQSPDSASSGEVQAIWSAKSNDLFSDLVYQMSQSLGLSFPKSYIADNSYHPDFHLLSEFESIEIRRLLLSVLKDGHPINIRAISGNET